MGTLKLCFLILEGVIITAIDKLAPLCKIVQKVKNVVVPPLIKNKINKRKRLLTQDKNLGVGNHAPDIKLLNCEINRYFTGIRTDRVRKCAMNKSMNLLGGGETCKRTQPRGNS